MIAVWIAGIISLISGALALIFQRMRAGDLVPLMFLLVLVCTFVAVIVGRKYYKTEKRNQSTAASSMALFGFILVVIANGLNMLGH